jgi:hypothetical protein
MSERGRAARIVSYVVLGVFGAVVAVAGALVQDGWFPGGLLLALAGCAGLFYGGAKLTGTRVGAVVPAGVWLVTVMFLSSTRPEGDFLFANTISPYAYLLGGSMAGVISATLSGPGLLGPPGARRPGAG